MGCNPPPNKIFCWYLLRCLNKLGKKNNLIKTPCDSAPDFLPASSIQIDNLPATDTSGYAGLADKVDCHTWRLLKGVMLSTLLGVGTELSLGNEKSDLVRAVRQSAQQNANQAGQRITERNLNIQPTITVRPGWPLRVIVHKDLVLRPYGK